MDAQYLKAHRQQVHNYDSFGRAVVERILQAAEEKLGTNSTDSPVVFQVEVSVSPIPAVRTDELQPQLHVCVDVTVLGATVHVGGELGN
ncbi:hypothetical protein [Burkholderia ambifaria]|uniref:hypothetical protein n=1 Tax=Burkholderia ambifaria TaxID=152480 RepID=UPI000F8028B4|nr:hypothetical protein [Burkholderia ambifaria]